MTVTVDRKDLNEKENCKTTHSKDKAKPVDPTSSAVVELLLKMLNPANTAEN